jgi:RNA polymerase sigma factor (sigma-70 family)
MRNEHERDSPAAQDLAIASAIERDRGRLWSFIRRRVRNPVDAEDILQDVFYELVVAYRLMKPIEEAGAWMVRVARNRIIDRVRRKKAVSLNQPVGAAEDDSNLRLENLLPSADAGPDAEYARRLLITELEDALAELTPNQRAVFLAHEFEGRSFRELAAETGLSVNALLSRKHQAVKCLRQRLQGIYDEMRTQERRTR